MFMFMAALMADDAQPAVEELYEKHKAKCYRVALAITRDIYLAEEAIQNAFLKLIKNKKKYFSNTCNLTAAYIVIMVKSAAIDILRREAKYNHAILDEAEALVPDDTPDALRIIEGEEAYKRLLHHVNLLDETNFTLFELKYRHKKNDGEIAEITGLKKNAVAVRINRIKNKLLNALREEGYIDG